jgi:cysteinyl-tRNA synthetase
MSTKYLGQRFDIHGGGLDLLFPHHEAEVAQSCAALGRDSVNYWMHNNMITINGQKMGKSLGNFITLDQFFSGDHPLLERAYSPMTIKLIIGEHSISRTRHFKLPRKGSKGYWPLLKVWTKLNLPIAHPLRFAS